MAPRKQKAPAQRLPRFIPPMLAKPGTAFDQDEHLFEVKWDGTRPLAFIEGGSYRMLNRRQIDMTARYPEFAGLAEFPDGTVLDGETIVFREGRPDFGLLLSREQARSPLKIRSLARTMPASYIVFDLLYERFRCMMELPLVERRRRLAALVSAAGMAQVVLSQEIIGPGRTFFEETCRQGLEGVIAKRLQSRYRPGQRSPAWRKIKPTLALPCVIIGYTPARHGLHSLLVATVRAGVLRYVAQLTCGLTGTLRRDLARLLEQRHRCHPVVPCPHTARWVEPEVYCQVRCFGWTRRGHMRDAVFRGLLTESA